MKRFLLFFSLVLFASGMSAQYSENFESYDCNRNNAFTVCHTFSATTLISSDANSIDNCSVRTNQLSNPGANTFYSTPALNFASATNITFDHRVSNTTSNPMVEIVAIDAINSSETTLFGPASISTAITPVSIPTTIEGLYRLEFRASGNGGMSRYYLDNISIEDATLAERRVDGDCELILPEPENVPSMGQWLTIIFGLVIFGFSTFVIYNMTDQRKNLM